MIETTRFTGWRINATHSVSELGDSNHSESVDEYGIAAGRSMPCCTMPTVGWIEWSLLLSQQSHICKILSLLQRALKPILGYPPHLKCVAALPWKTYKKFCILMYIKHVSSVTFYHLSDRYLPNVMKISAKINAVQNINILLFVRSLSLRNWRNAYLRYGPISDRTLLTLQ